MGKTTMHHRNLNDTLMLFCFTSCGDLQANGWYSLEVRRPGGVASRRDGRRKDSAAGEREYAPATTTKDWIHYTSYESEQTVWL